MSIEPEASVESSHAEITMEMKAYVNALKENKNKLSGTKKKPTSI